MNNKCKYLKVGINKFKCKKQNDKEIILNDCKNCKFKDYKKVDYKPIKINKPIKQRTSKQAKLERDRFSILTNNLNKCIECGRENCNINLHEVFYGTGKRKLSIKYGLIAPLCTISCHNQRELRGIHFDEQMCVKWHKKAQKQCIKYYGMSKDEFREIFGKNYL